MADELDPNPELRDEYTAALSKLDPQRRGYVVIRAGAVAAGGPPEEIASIDARIASSASRWQCIMDVIALLDATIVARRKLRDNGYPTTIPSNMEPGVLEVLQGQARDYDAGLAMFRATGQAVSADLSFGHPEANPTA